MYERNKKRAECIVELYKHAGIFKNTREVQRSTSRSRTSRVFARARSDDIGCVHYISTVHSCDVRRVLYGNIMNSF